MPQGNIKMTEMQFSNKELIPEIIKLLDSGHTVTLKLRGNSMRPFLEDGRDKALLKHPENISEGVPVLAEISKGQFVLHRIAKIEGNNVTLLGDGNLTPEHCTVNDIKGQVIGFYRKGRDKMDRTDGRKWLIYSRLWTALRPFRRYLLFIYRHIGIKL